MPSAFSRPTPPDGERKPLPSPATLADTYLYDIAVELRRLNDTLTGMAGAGESVTDVVELREPDAAPKRKPRGKAE